MSPFQTWVRADDGGGGVGDRLQSDGDFSHPGVEWLKELWDRGDTKTIDEMVALWKTFEMLGKVGGILRHIIIVVGKSLMWLSGIFAAYFALSGEFTKWWNR